MKLVTLVAFAAFAACRHASPPPPRSPPVIAAARADAAATARVCRSALTMPERRVAQDDDAFASSPATAPAIQRACAAQARTTQVRLAAALRDFDADARDKVLAPLLQCADAGEGAWTFSVTVGAPRPSSPEHTVEYPVRARAVYVAPSGALRPTAFALRLVVSRATFAHTVAIERLGVFDWDGDGRAELFFREAHTQEENQNDVASEDRWWILTARGASAPREYVSEGVRTAWIDDYDGDGRPDLLLRSPWVAVGPCGLSEVDNPGPQPLLHAAVDGRFVDDAVSHAWLAQQCPEAPGAFFDAVGTDAEEDVAQQPQFRVACARLYGLSAGEVEMAVDRTWPPGTDGRDSPAWCYPRKQLLHLARVDPPGAFRLACDPTPAPMNGDPDPPS